MMPLTLWVEESGGYLMPGLYPPHSWAFPDHRK